jgi:phosphatidylinositol glycan class K
MLWLYITLPIWTADKFAVVVSSSRYWYNYRHSSNALAIHHVLRKHNIPESNILLFLAQDFTCDCRNIESGSVFYDIERSVDLGGGNPPQIDFTQDSVQPINFLRTLRGEFSPFLPRSQRLVAQSTDEILVFFTGHSGVGFMKFQDLRELPADVLNTALLEMEVKGRFSSMMWISDTCKGAALHKDVEIDNFVAISSSSEDENSYGYQADAQIGVLTSDRFSQFSTKFLLKNLKNSPTLHEYKSAVTFDKLSSTATIRDVRDNGKTKIDKFMTRNVTGKHISWRLLKHDHETRQLYDDVLISQMRQRPRNSAPTCYLIPVQISAAAVMLGVIFLV